MKKHYKNEFNKAKEKTQKLLDIPKKRINIYKLSAQTLVQNFILDIKTRLHESRKKKVFQKQFKEYQFDYDIKQSSKNEIKAFKHLVEQNRSLIINDRSCRIYYLYQLPDIINYTNILRLLNSGLPLDISYFINSTQRSAYLKMLRTRRVILIGANNERKSKGLDSDPNKEREINEVESIIDSMINDDQKAFMVGIYVSIKANSNEQLIEYCSEFEDLSSQLDLQFYPTTFTQKDSFPSTLPLARDTIKKTINLQTNAVTELFPFLSRNIQNDSGIFLGVSRTNYNSMIILDPFKARNANIMILGTSGSGKSVTSKSLLIKLVMRQIQCLIIDPEGEYNAITQKCNGEVISFSTQRGLNIFDLDFVSSEAKNNHITTLKNFFRFIIDEDKYSDSKLDILLTKFYNAGKLTMTDFIKLAKKEKVEFLEDLEKLVSGSMKGIFDSSERINMSSGVINFDLSNLGADNMKLPAMYIIASIIDNQINKGDVQRMIFIDEAHLFLKHEFTRDFYIRLQKTVRKRKAGVISITQNAEDYSEINGAKTIITQAETVILLKQHTASIGFFKRLEIFDLNEKEYNELYSFDKGEAILFREKEHIPIKIEPFESEWEYIQT